MAKPDRSSAADSLTGKQILAYALVMAPLCVGQMPLLFVVPYFAQVLGLNLAMLGLILTIGRIFDVGADMGVAYLSDSIVTRFGRRRPWVLIGLPLFALSGWLLFVPWPSMNMTRYGVAIFVFFISWTVAFIPYLSQGTELSTDPIKRGRINIAQSVTMMIGFLVAYTLPLLLVDKRSFAWREAAGDALSRLHMPALDGLAALLHTQPLSDVASYGRTMLTIVIINSVAIPIALLAYGLLVPDRSAQMTKAKGSMKDAFRNMPFLRFCIGYILIITAYIGRLGLFPFLLAFWFQRADLLLVLILVQYFVSLLVTPLWSHLFKRIERKTCIAVAAMIELFGVICLAFMPPGNDGLLIGVYALLGLGGQTLYMAPYLVAADSADYARWKFGTESRAVHVSMISLITKFGSVAAAVSIWLAGAFGFDPKLAVQPHSMILMLKILGFLVPGLLLVAGAALVITYPMNRKRQAAIQRRLDIRAATEAALVARALQLAFPTGTRVMTSNADIVTLFFSALSAGRLDEAEGLIAQDSLHHMKGVGGDLAGATGWRGAEDALRAGFPDRRFTIHHLLSEGDRVAARFTWTATHGGDYAGRPASGRTVEVNGMTVFRLLDGKIVEQWAEQDILNLHQQIGAQPGYSPTWPKP